MSRPQTVAKPTPKKKTHVLSNAERQARFRAKRDARLRELEARAALRNEAPPLKVVSLRNATRSTESLDDALTRLRQIGDRLVAEYERLAVTPGLSRAQLATVLSRFDGWRKRVKGGR